MANLTTVGEMSADDERCVYSSSVWSLRSNSGRAQALVFAAPASTAAARLLSISHTHSSADYEQSLHLSSAFRVLEMHNTAYAPLVVHKKKSPRDFNAKNTIATGVKPVKQTRSRYPFRKNSGKIYGIVCVRWAIPRR